MTAGASAYPAGSRRMAATQAPMPTRTTRPARQAAGISSRAYWIALLIELELILVVELQRFGLPRLLEVAVADRERVDLRAHEAAEGVLGRADDRFAAHVEAGVDDHRTARQPLELRDERVVA